MFDTHKIFTSLTGAGVPADQASAHVDALRSAVNEDRLATKHDLGLLKRDLAIQTTAIVGAVIGLATVIERFVG